jgi:hypothetical protein
MRKQNKYTWARFNVTFVILLFSMVFSFAGCGGGGGGGGDNGGISPNSPTTYKLFSDGYFTAGTQESYNLTGSSTSGASYTGTLLIDPQSATTFNGAAAIPVEDQLSLTNTDSHTSITLTGVEYFSTDASNLELLGYNSNNEGTTTSGASLSVIPQSASIGDSGNAGTYTFSNGDILTITWELTQASGSFANLVMSSTVTTSTGSMLLTEENAFVIDQDGNRQSVTIVLDAESYGISVTLSGNKS